MKERTSPDRIPSFPHSFPSSHHHLMRWMTSHERNQASTTSPPPVSRIATMASPPIVSMIAERGAGRYGYDGSRVAKSNHASNQAAERWDEMMIDKKIAPARAPEEPINGALDESDGGGRTRRAALTTSTCQETKKGESNIQARVLIYPPPPK